MCMGEETMLTEYRVTHHVLALNSVFSGGQLDLGECNDRTEVEYGVQGPDTEVSL